ncbi:MAG: outer membrane protein assembly factor BamA [Cycloclasticus sp.]|nr:outer membrane protein assembly factor BamA [Cycloclasticus sp.]
MWVSSFSKKVIHKYILSRLVVLSILARQNLNRILIGFIVIKKIRTSLFAVALLFAFLGSTVAFAVEPFVIKDIRVNGLQRITAGAVFNALTIKVGDRFDDDRSSDIIRELFQMGFFSDVNVGQEAGSIIINVKERPAITSIEMEGNGDIETETLLEAFKDVGMAVGRVFNPLVLDKVKNELLQQYYNNGKYSAEVESTVTNLERNRVAILISVVEGSAASIKKLNVVGNKSYSDDEILDEFELTGPTLISFYTNSNQYSKQKLSADLERLNSFYQDRGYINFKVESTQVSISPDKNGIYITINIDEGKVHRVSEVKLAGELIVTPDKLIPYVLVQPGDIFSRKKATQTSEFITTILGHQGHSFANVNMIPEIDADSSEVKVTFFVDPGKRVYVRRIIMEGNTKTRDEVLRREIRQMEAAPISTSSVDHSKSRLSRLGHFDEVDVETFPVPGTSDQVDIKYTVKEKSSGNILAGAGFSQSQGLVLNASISQNNFLGTGKRMSASFNNSSVNTIYSLGYTNPYYTIDGVSRGYNISYRTTDAEEANTSNYSTETFNAGVNFGFPLNESDKIGLGFDLEFTSLDLGYDPAVVKQGFILGGASESEADAALGQTGRFVLNNGESYTNLKMSAVWGTDTRNRAVFATRGGSKRLSGVITVPGSDLEFYKLSYNQKQYYPITPHTTLYLNADFGYGDSYGDAEKLPFFENYYAGGKGSVRGFTDNTLGPKDLFNDPTGGSVKLVGNAEFVFPVPFMTDNNAVRLSTFLDAGNVYDDEIDLGEIRYSVGMSAKWLSPFGPLSFSLALPLNDDEDDELQSFQFSFGSGI